MHLVAPNIKVWSQRAEDEQKAKWKLSGTDVKQILPFCWIHRKWFQGSRQRMEDSDFEGGKDLDYLCV